MTHILSLESRINWRWWRDAVLFELDTNARGKGRPRSFSRPVQSIIHAELLMVAPGGRDRYARYLAGVYGYSHSTIRRIIWPQKGSAKADSETPVCRTNTDTLKNEVAHTA